MKRAAGRHERGGHPSRASGGGALAANKWQRGMPLLSRVLPLTIAPSDKKFPHDQQFLQLLKQRAPLKSVCAVSPAESTGSME